MAHDQAMSLPNVAHVLDGVDSPFLSAIVLSKNRSFSLGFRGFLERMHGKNGEGPPRPIGNPQVIGFL